jgi:hypothetical protein
MEDKSSQDDTEEPRVTHFWTFIQLVGAISLALICVVLIQFEAFQSATGAKILPPLLFLSGLLFYRASRNLRKPRKS